MKNQCLAYAYGFASRQTKDNLFFFFHNPQHSHVGERIMISIDKNKLLPYVLIDKDLRVRTWSS